MLPIWADAINVLLYIIYLRMATQNLQVRNIIFDLTRQLPYVSKRKRIEEIIQIISATTWHNSNKYVFILVTYHKL